MEYKLIQATDAEALESRVAKAIQEGFIPCGGVSAVVNRRAYLPEYLYAQAMTRVHRNNFLEISLFRRPVAIAPGES